MMEYGSILKKIILFLDDYHKNNNFTASHTPLKQG
jgi:hypothetical protein